MKIYLQKNFDVDVSLKNRVRVFVEIDLYGHDCWTGQRVCIKRRDFGLVSYSFPFATKNTFCCECNFLILV